MRGGGERWERGRDRQTDRLTGRARVTVDDQSAMAWEGVLKRDADRTADVV